MSSALEQRLELVVRRAALGLKVIAVLLALGTIYSAWTSTFVDLNQFFPGAGPSPQLPMRAKISQFAGNPAPNVAWCCLVFAAAVALQIMMVRLGRTQAEPAVGDDTFDPPIVAERPTAVSTAMPDPRDVLTPTITLTDDTVWRR